MRAGFVFSEAMTGIRRNVTMTIAMILTTAVSLAVLGFGIIISGKVSQTEEIYGDKLSVQVYLTIDQSKTDIDCRAQVCQTLQEELRANPEVESVTYESQPAAYQRFQKMFAGQPEVLQAGREEALPASFQVKLKDPNRFAIIKEQYGAKPGVQSVQDGSQVVSKLLGILATIRNAAIGLAIFQAIAAILLIANTVMVAARSRRVETSIMRLVGASRWRTELPFMIEAIIAGLIGVVVAAGMLVAAKLTFLDRILGGIVSAGIVQPVSSNDLLLASWWLLPIGAVLSAATAWVTLRLSVKV